MPLRVAPVTALSVEFRVIDTRSAPGHWIVAPSSVTTEHDFAAHADGSALGTARPSVAVAVACSASVA